MQKIVLLGLTVALVSHSANAKIPTVPESWVGIYNDEQKISLFFKQNGAQLTGRSLLNGKEISFVGTVKENGKITLKEQGQGNAIGMFEFTYRNAKAEMEGSWQSLNGQVRPKFFNVQIQQCQYAKGQGEFPYVSSRLLKDVDLQVPLGQLQYMRNEIYARHGYAFANKEWAIAFAHEDWYMPCYRNVENRLSDIEKQNIKRIKMVEPYAQDVDWGR